MTVRDPIPMQEPRQVSIEELREVFGPAMVPEGITAALTATEREEWRRQIAWLKSLPNDPEELLRALAERYSGIYLPPPPPACVTCGNPVVGRRGKLYCSPNCAVRHWKQMNPERAAEYARRAYQRKKAGKLVQDREAVPA